MAFSGVLLGSVVSGLIAASHSGPATGSEATPTTPSVEAVSSFYETSATGVVVREEHGRVQAPPVISALSSANAAGPLWSTTDPNWVGKSISIGNQGSQVFTE